MIGYTAIDIFFQLNNNKGAYMNIKLFLSVLMVCGSFYAMQYDGEEIVKELESLTIFNLLQRNAYHLLSPEEQKVWEAHVFNRKHKPLISETEEVQGKVVTYIIDDPFTRSIIHPYFLDQRPKSPLHIAMLKRVSVVTPNILRRIIGK
jgi:hypothetical protein